MIVSIGVGEGGESADGVFSLDGGSTGITRGIWKTSRRDEIGDASTTTGCSEEIVVTCCGDASTDGVGVATSGYLVGTGTRDVVSCVCGSKTICSGDPGDLFGLKGFGLFTAADVAATSPSTVVEGGADTLCKKEDVGQNSRNDTSEEEKGVNRKIHVQQPVKASWTNAFVKEIPLPDLQDRRHPPSKRQIGEGLV